MGLKRGAKQIRDKEHDGRCSQLRSLTLDGMTISPRAANCLKATLPLLSNLKGLTLRGNFTLVELDHKKSSIMGHVYSEMIQVTDSLHSMLRNLPRLKYLDLQRCHLPDEFLADILDALYPESIQTLNLNGNMTCQESHHVLRKILSDPRCGLSHLDLSWQRRPNTPRNCSILDLDVLPTVLADENASLRTLNLSENMLLDEDVGRLAVAMSRHPNLCRVYLQDCHISDGGLIALAHTLPKCQENLRRVYLNGKQNIHRAALVRKTIFQALLRNFYLLELVLPYAIQSKSMNWTLELNRAGRRALLQHDVRNCPDPAIECTIDAAPSFDSQSGTNHIPRSLWPCVLRRADRIARKDYFGEDVSTAKGASAIYFLLREKGHQAIFS
eukprot:jgi/Psemu1/301561/fgenesh1_kg.38_\